MYVQHRPEIFPSPRWDLTCFAIVLSGRRCFHQQWHSDLVIMHHHWQHSWIRACSRLKCLITLMLDMLALTHACKCFGQLQGVRAAETLKTSHRPNGIFTCFALCLQGGGVYVRSGTVTISSCTISGNTANYVRAHAQEFPLPRCETHVLLVVCRAVVWQSMEAQWQS